jgi:hypothetical protein
MPDTDAVTQPIDAYRVRLNQTQQGWGNLSNAQFAPTTTTIYFLRDTTSSVPGFGSSSK